MKNEGKLTFSKARARLDEILHELESDAGDIDQLAERVKEASELIRFCRERLTAARKEVTQIVAEVETGAEEAEDEPPASGLPF